MNRTGLFIALGIGLAGGLLFGFFPGLDLRLAALFYDPAHGFAIKENRLAGFARDAAMWIAWAFAAPAILALIVKLIFPRKRLLISARAIAFLLLTMLLAAGVLSNLVFKSHWGRPRPVVTVEFGGTLPFVPWWDPRGRCPRNCSFFSGEAATAFWTYAPAALTPPHYRALAYAGATVFGLATGGLRMMFGGHYATDVIFAGVVVFLIVWLFHGMIYRWPRPPKDDDDLDRRFGNAVLSMRGEVTTPPPPLALTARTTFWLVCGAFALLTLVRILGLSLSVVDLFYDEAKYWAWAQSPALGYPSKPPLLAWIVAGANRVCGSSEACLRAPLPLFYFGTALLTYLIAKSLYGVRAAIWSSACLMLAPGVVFSTRVISPDVPLLFFWALALLAFVRLREVPRWHWAAVLGVALGLGFLSNYAMVYFAFGVALAAIWDAQTRIVLRQRHAWVALGIGALIVLPHFAWLATHGFVTWRAEAGELLQGVRPNLLRPLEFLASQFGIFGPVVFGAFILLLIRPSFYALDASDRIMVAMAVPPLALVATFAVLAKVSPNWAGPSIVSLIIVAVALMVRREQWRAVYVTLAIGVLAQDALWIGDARAYRMSIPALVRPDLYDRTLGWSDLGRQAGTLAENNGAMTIAADQRDVVTSLVYQARGSEMPVLAWPLPGPPRQQVDTALPLTKISAEPVLFISNCANTARLGAQYADVELLGRIESPTGRFSQRRFYGFKLSGPKGPIVPLGPCGS